MSAREASEDVGATNPLMRLAVIVPVHDGGEDIFLCLAALIGAEQSPHDILVIDDASSDGAARTAARTHGTRHVSLVGGPHGPARARNEGARIAADEGADAFVFIDADVIVHEAAIARFRELLATSPDTAAAFGSYDDSPPAPGCVSQYKNLLHHRMHQTGASEACTFWSGCGCVRRDAFLATGGFDERFGRASIEDVDLGLRLTDAGYRVRLCPEILCSHRKAWSLSGWLRTDIFLRALPWSRLLVARRQGIPDSLNLGRRERVSAGLALVVALSALALPLAPAPAAIALIVALSGFVLLQRDLLGFFARRRGLAFAAAATLMHLCYFVCSSVVFAGVCLATLLGNEPQPHRS